MNTETIEHDGYKIEIAQDFSPENPFEARDCEPPLVTYYGGRHGYAKSYQGAPETIGDIVRLLPASMFERGERVKTIKANLNCTLREFVAASRDNRAWGIGPCFSNMGDCKEVFISFAESQVGQEPEGWRDACNWFEFAESLLKQGGIACHHEQSNGYSQGDSTLLLAIATPEWIAKVGASPDSLPAQMKSACDLYSAWAWGDVYGIVSIHEIVTDDEGNETEGEEIEDASVWGFYGRDHETSGLLESARDSIAHHKRAKAETALNEPKMKIELQAASSHTMLHVVASNPDESCADYFMVDSGEAQDLLPRLLVVAHTNNELYALAAPDEMDILDGLKDWHEHSDENGEIALVKELCL